MLSNTQYLPVLGLQYYCSIPLYYIRGVERRTPLMEHYQEGDFPSPFFCELYALRASQTSLSFPHGP